MKQIPVIVFLISWTSLYASPDSLQWSKKIFPDYYLYYTDADSSVVSIIGKDLATGTNLVTDFFKKEFSGKFDIYIFPDRKAMNDQWRKDWNITDFTSECWMVASGAARRLDILSPLIWEKDACEHNGKNDIEVQQIITHELVHVFHAQQNPNPGFEGMDDLSWLVEGLATYASGQLTNEKINTVKNQIANGNSPKNLSDFWKGKLRYQQAGSLMKFIDNKYGRKKVFDLLRHTSLAEILKFLEISENALISQWREYYK